MSDGFTVTVEDLSASSRVFTRLHTEALDALSGAAAGLTAEAGMAGDDPVLAPWRAEYDALTAVIWSVVGTSTGLLADIADRLVRTGNGYLDADRASGGTVDGLLPEPPPPGPTPARPPSSTGPTGPGVPSELAAYWPGGDPALLRDAALAWSTLADRLDDGGFAADAGFRSLIDANSGATFSAMGAYWSGHFDDCGTDLLFNAGPSTARRLARSCAALADAIDRSRAEVGRAAADAAADLDHVAAPAPARPDHPGCDRGHPPRRGGGADVEVPGRLPRLLPPGRRPTRRGAAGRRPRPSRTPRLASPAHTGGRRHAGRRRGRRGARPGRQRLGRRRGVHPHPDAVHLTAAGRAHILDGDKDGGGHLSGRRIPGKSEFPPSWTGDRIMATVLELARAPDAQPIQGREKRWVVEGVRDEVRVRVIVDPAGRIVTAVPLSGPGVIQNPRRR